MINRFPSIVTEVKESPDQRRKGPSPWVGIIIHHTDIGKRDPKTIDEQGWRKLFANVTDWLTKQDENYLSAHFHVGRFGECAQLVDPDNSVAFHAGKSSFWHPLERKMVDGWNEYAIGIELLGDGNLQGFDYSDQQYATAAKLCAALMKRYPAINPLCIVGHEMIAPGRKVDPGKAFDWQHFYKLIYDFYSEPIAI